MGLVTGLLIGAGAIALILLVLSRFYYINQWGEVVSKLEEQRQRREDERYKEEERRAQLAFESEARAVALRAKALIANMTLSEERVLAQPCAFLTHHFQMARYRVRMGSSRKDEVLVDVFWTVAGGFQFIQRFEDQSPDLWAMRDGRAGIVGTIDSVTLTRFNSIAYKAMDAIRELDGQRSASEYAALRRLARIVFYGDESVKEFFASLRQSRDFRDLTDELASEARDQRQQQDLHEQREHDRKLAEARMMHERELVEQQRRHELELAELQEPVEVVFPEELNLRVRPKRWWES